MQIPVGFPNWNPSWGRISRSWNPSSDIAFDRKIRNPDSDSPIKLCQTRGRLFKVPYFSMNCRGQSSSLIGCHPELLWRAKTGKSRKCPWGRTEGVILSPKPTCVREILYFLRRSTSTITEILGRTNISLGYDGMNFSDSLAVWVPDETFLHKFNNH